MKKYIVYILFIVTFVCGCRSRTTDYQESKRDIKYHTAAIDTVKVKIDNTSFSGFSGVNNDELYFFDEYFCWYWRVSIDGEVISRHIGQGRGPDELPASYPDEVTIDVNNTLLVTGASYDAHIFENFKNRQSINVRISEDEDSYDDTRAYTAYTPNYILRRFKDKFYYNVYMEHPQMNPAFFSREFFNNARILMEVDINSGNTRVLGNYPQSFRDNPNKLNHWFGALYDIDDNGHFHVSFQADSLIYEYRNDFELVRAYGFEGSKMDTDYKTISGSWESVFSKYEDDRENRGYYYWIKHIPELNMTFRSYQKSSKEPFDGLQIYEDGVLVGDIDVPKNFRVTGYIAPYFVTKIADRYTNEDLQFFRFTLK